MRIAALLLLLVVTTPVVAGEWGRYENARFGYVIDIPPGFREGGEAANGDGQVFRGGSGAQLLTVFGGSLFYGFEAEVAQRKSFAADVGWTLTYEAGAPGWAVWSGRRGGRILYARIIPLCGERRFAMFELEYPAADAAGLDPLVGRIARSLRPTGAGAGC